MNIKSVLKPLCYFLAVLFAVFCVIKADQLTSHVVDLSDVLTNPPKVEKSFDLTPEEFRKRYNKLALFIPITPHARRLSERYNRIARERYALPEELPELNIQQNKGKNFFSLSYESNNITLTGIVDQEGKLASLTILLFNDTYETEDVKLRKVMLMSNMLLTASSAIDDEITPEAIEITADELLEELKNLKPSNSQKMSVTTAPKTIGRVIYTITGIIEKAIRFDLTAP